jgi:putative ABC transport system permease protein
MGADGYLAFALRYAARSLWRNKRRTILTIATVALSVDVTTVALRYSVAAMQLWEQGSIDYGNGHAQIHAKGYDERPDVITEGTSLAAGAPIEAALAADPAVEVASRRLIFEGVISANAKTIYFLGRAVAPETELKACPQIFHPGTDPGRFVDEGDPMGISIGQGLADTLGLKLGDEASLLVHTMKGAVNGVDVRVTGIVAPPVPALSKRLVYLPLAAAQKALEFPGRYTELVIRLKPGVDAEGWVARVKPEAAAKGLDLKGWWTLDPLIRNIKKVWDSILGVITALLFMSAAFSVLNIIFMTVAERTVEIGTLAAIGAKPKDIRTLFMVEAALIGVLGGLVGSAVANTALFLVDRIGLEFDSPFGAGKIIVHPRVDGAMSLVISAIGIGICVISALAPARKAAQVEPVTAFRGQLT